MNNPQWKWLPGHQKIARLCYCAEFWARAEISFLTHGPFEGGTALGYAPYIYIYDFFKPYCAGAGAIEIWTS